MKKIKFRAWDKNYKKHLFSNDFERFCDFFAILEGIPDRFEVLEQFTGLLDKNGKEIYEGDVLDIEVWKPKNLPAPAVEMERVAVTWGEGEWLAGRLALNANNFMDDKGEYTEIIGNIYENPELLKP